MNCVSCSKVWGVTTTFLMLLDLRGATVANPVQLSSGPCSIERYVSSRIANRYISTRIFDAVGKGTKRQLFASFSLFLNQFWQNLAWL